MSHKKHIVSITQTNQVFKKTLSLLSES